MYVYVITGDKLCL